MWSIWLGVRIYSSYKIGMVNIEFLKGSQLQCEGDNVMFKRP